MNQNEIVAAAHEIAKEICIKIIKSIYDREDITSTEKDNIFLVAHCMILSNCCISFRINEDPRKALDGIISSAYCCFKKYENKEYTEVHFD